MPIPITTRGPLTAADWTAQNPTLGQFEIGIEVDPATGLYGKMKIGDGRTSWNSLSYVGQPAKVYRALLTQTGTDAPVATVLENTLGGSLTWGYNDAGNYSATATAGTLPAGKTFCMSIGNVASIDADNGYVYMASLVWAEADTLSLKTGQMDETPNVTLVNGILSASTVTVLVYP